MRFKFCGDLDAPEWLLREVASLSRMTYVRIKLLVMHVLAVQTHRLPALDMDKVRKLVSTAEFTPSDIRGAIAAIIFILRGAAQYDVQPEGLGKELSQIGLPAEHSRAFWKAYQGHADDLRDVLLSQTLALPGLKSVHWRVDYILSCGAKRGVNQPAAQLAIELADGTKTSFVLSADKLRVLLEELREARSLLAQSTQQ